MLVLKPVAITMNSPKSVRITQIEIFLLHLKVHTIFAKVNPNLYQQIWHNRGIFLFQNFNIKYKYKGFISIIKINMLLHTCKVDFLAEL